MIIKENAHRHPANRQAGELIRLYQWDKLTRQAITERLNERGFPTRYGKRFQGETVRRILNG